MHAERELVHAFRVGTFTVEASFRPLSLEEDNHVFCEWLPCVPGRPLSRRERRQYDRGIEKVWRLAFEAQQGVA